MTELGFSVRDIVAEPYAVTPLLTVGLTVTETTGAVVHAIALHCQVRIEPQRRPYSDAEAAGMLDLFGPRSRWSDTLRPYLWLQTTALVPGFTGSTEAALPLPCTYDFDVAASKYLHALSTGVVPLTFLFSGTVFTRGTNGFTVARVPWDAETSYPMPVEVWQHVLDQHFPDSAWLRVGRESFGALHRFRTAHGLLTAGDALDALLDRAGAAGTSEPSANAAGRDDAGIRESVR